MRNSCPGVLLSIIGGGVSGLLCGMIGAGIEQRHDDSFSLRLYKRLLLEFLIQLSGPLSIPFGCMITFSLNSKKIEEMVIRYMIGHSIIVGTKFLVLMTLMRNYPIA